MGTANLRDELKREKSSNRSACCRQLTSRETHGQRINGYKEEPVVLNEQKYVRHVPLLCPTCGCNDFEVLEGVDELTEVVKCALCGHTLTKDELVSLNSESIDNHLQEIGQEAASDIQKELVDMLKKTFKGNNNVRFR